MTLNLEMTSVYGSYSSIGSLFFFTFVFGIPCGLLCSSLANNKGYNPWRWFACGVLFNLLGLIAAAGLPDRILRNQLREVLENKSWASKINWNLQSTFEVQNEKTHFISFLNALMLGEDQQSLRPVSKSYATLLLSHF